MPARQPASRTADSTSDYESRRPIVPKKDVPRTLAERYDQSELGPLWQELCDWATD